MYWSWNGGPREGRGSEALEKGGQISGGGGAGGGWDSIFENDQSAKVLDIDTQMKLFEYATDITDAEWPEIKAITSPCPTLKVIGAVTKGMVKREELKRMREMGRPGIVETQPVKPSRRKRVAMATDRVVSGVLSNTVGRVARFAGKRVLGQIPDEAVNGSFDAKAQESKSTDDEVSSENDLQVLAEDQQLLEKEVAPQLAKKDVASIVDNEDEALFLEIFEAETATSSSPEKSKSRVGV